MALAETARLIASLELKDSFSKQIGNAEKSLSSFNTKLDQTQSRSFRAGQQIGVGIKRTAAIAVGALGGLTSLLALTAKEGQHAADVQNVYNKAIQTSGKISAAYVKQLDAQALALSNLTGQDDELIRSEQTRLIQMGLTGQQITKLLPLILDAAQSTGRDLDSVTLAVGRAVQGSATSLGKLGIIVPKVAKETKSAALISLEQARSLVQVQIAQAKANGTFEKGRKTTLEHRKAVLDAEIAQQKYNDSLKGGTKAASNFDQVLSALHPFEGVNQALSQSLDVKLKVFRERLQDIREEAGIKLLPALGRIVDVTTKNLLPAFQKFIDAVLPTAIKGLNEFADFLQNGGATKALSSLFDTLKTAAPILQNSAEATLNIVKAAVGLFQSLPPDIQKLAAGAFAVNKLTGGLITNIAGGVLDLVGKSRGASPANPVFVSDVSGGLGGAATKGVGLLPALGNIATKLGGIALVLGGLEGLSAGANTGGPAGAGIGALSGAAIIGGGALAAGPAGAIVGAIVAVGKTVLDIRDNSTKQSDTIAASIAAQISGGAKLGDLRTSLAAVDDGINQLQANPLLVLLSGDALDQLKAQRELLQKQVLAQTKVATPAAGNATPKTFGPQIEDLAGKIKDDIVNLHQLTRAVGKEFTNAINQLRRPRSDSERRNAALELVKRVSAGLGDFKNTASGLAALRTALKATHDSKTAAIIRNGINLLERKIPGRAYADKELARFGTLIADGKLTKSELVQAKAIMARLTDHGLPHAASVISARIDAAKRDIVEQQRINTETVKDKDTNVTVNTKVVTNVTAAGILRTFQTRVSALGHVGTA